ncbi:MAG: ABC transporter permease [Alphaproteobacteria bacterium]|nr:ABC transporter permease [Alphaproteobacteria bacterium]|tara:strand:- start:787 stop:1521 length:735 start_codon:yes stop_codon:yes gene_type:complete
MLNIWIVSRRELAAYFTSPLAYVFIVIFLALAGGLTFFFGQWLERGQADLQVFFLYHPYLYLFLIPAVGMRLWAEERKSGTIEFLLTLPVTTGQIVIGKFLAAWIFAGIALALTFPMWVTVNMLGQPDNGIILAAYIGSWLMAGGFLALSACISALTKNQVIAFVLASALCFVFMMSGVEIIQSFFRAWTPQAFVESVAELSFLTHFNDVSQGVIDIRDVVFFLSVIGVALFANAAIVEAKKGV